MNEQSLLRRFQNVHPRSFGHAADCPACGGRGSLALTISDGRLTVNCRGADSCSKSDILQAVGLTPDAMAITLNTTPGAPQNLTSHDKNTPYEVRLQAVDATELLKAGISEEPESLPMLGTLGYFLKGWSHLVAGYPKCGKTELVFASVREWLPEGLSVLWFSEESRAVWQQRLVRHPDLPPGLSLVCAIGAEQSDMLDLARSRTDDVVIIDTLRNLLGLRDENDNAEVARTLGPWETLTGKTRIYLHHERKMGGEHGQAIAGGGAFLGIVDRAIELKYDPHDTKRRQLVVHSRITEAPDLLYELGEDGLKVLGQPDEIALLQVKQRLRETLNVDFQKLVDIQELLDPKPSRSQLQKALREMFRDREVERDPADDKSGATYRWRLIF